MTSEPSRDRLALVLALAQLALGLLWGAFHELGGWITEADFYGMYAPGAEALARGEPYVYTRSGPGLSALLAPFAAAGVDVFLVAKVLAALSLAGLGLAAYFVAARAVSGPVGLALQALLYLVLQRFAFVAGNDIPAAALAWAALAFLAAQQRPRLRECLVAGLCAGLSFLTRYTGAALVVAAAVALLAFVRPWERAARLRATGAFLGGVLLVATPWLVASQAWFGTPLHNKTHALIALDAFAGDGDRFDQGLLERMEERFPSLLDVLRHDPVQFVRYYAFDFLEDANQLVQDVVPFPAYLWLGLGLALLAARASSRPWVLWLVALFALSGFLGTALAPYQARYFYALAPALLLPVAVAFAEPWRLAGRELRAFRLVIVASAVLVLAGGSAYKTHEYLTSEPTELLPVRAVLAEHARAGERLMARKPHLGSLTGLETLGVPAGPPARVLALARERGVRYLYVGPGEVRWNRELGPLAAGEEIPDSLRLLHQNRAPDACLYALE